MPIARELEWTVTGLCGRERELIHVAFDVWNAIDSDKGNGSRKNADEARKPGLKKVL